MMLSQKFVSSVSAVMVVVFGLGCAATPDGRKTQAQGTAIGAVLGALAGGAIGYATGGRDGIARGAVVGGAAGGVAGFAYGTHVARMKAKYASREAWLDDCIASARRVNSNAYAYSRTLEGRIAQLQTRTRRVAASGNKSQARALKREIAALKVEANGKSSEVQKEVTAQQGALSEGRGADNHSGLSKEVNSLQQTKGTLGRQVNRLAGLENQLDV
ncbi:MAG TPA: hypothetical protein VF593_06840 [Chthoniobacteraceae bacterium]|jgi:hypothetical protein